MKNNLSDLFNLTELKKFIFKRDSLKVECCTHLLEGNYQEASKASLKLFDASPFYLFLSYFMQLKEGKSNENVEKLLEIIVDRQDVTPEIALLLAKENLFVHASIKFLKNYGIRDYIYQIIKKELIIKGHLPFEENIIDELDDWSLYEFALANDIPLKKRETVNYEYYIAHKDSSKTSQTLFKKIRIYKDLEYLSRITNTTSHEDYVTDCLLKFIRQGFKLEKAQEMFKALKGTLAPQYNPLEDTKTEQTRPVLDKFNLLKCLLGHLIASKDANLLVFSLYLTFSYRTHFSSNYEISLIHLFLCRFFWFYKPVDDLLREFGLKNNQFFNLFFILNDMILSLGIRETERQEEYKQLLQENLKIIKNSLKLFIEKGKIEHAASLIKVYNNLKGEVVAKEIESKKILCDTPETLFSDLLGGECSYLFRKMTKDDAYPSFKENTLSTLSFSLPLKNSEDLFSNPLENIKDERFISWFKENLR